MIPTNAQEGQKDYVKYEVEKVISIPKFFNSLSDEEFSINRIALEGSKEKSDANAFWIEKVPDDELKDIGNILSALPQL